MNTNIDLPQELLYKEGNIWINGKNGQLRYNSKDDATSQWLNPLSTYKVGSSTKLKKGQPVAIGYESQLDNAASGVGDSAIVLADPSINQFSVGILLEPGDINSNKEVHVQSHGQVEYSISNLKNDDYYLPPNENGKFKWTYADIGKPVYVSNKNKGELTLDLAEATYDGGTIICVGRIADAPLGTEELEKYQKILIEVQLSGDVRGVVDSTQISVDIVENQSISAEDNKSDYDKIIPVKVIDGKGVLVLNDTILKQNIENDIAGVFVATSKDGSLSLDSYLGKTITLTRLGIVSGNFGFDVSSFGKTAFVKNGQIDFENSSDSIEFKIGVGFGTNKFLVDCRYAKSIQSSDMIGTIKPVFGENLTDIGYALIDEAVHSVYNDEINWVPLLTYCYAKDIFVFSKNKNGPFTRVNEGKWELYGETTGKGILSKSQPTYFKFRDLYYTLDGGKKCAAQIKYSREGSPESQAYVWPEQCYQLDIPYVNEGTAGGTIESSNIRINISNLVKLGAYMDNNSQNIETYDIIVQEKESKQIISPGFWQKPDGTWVGYEWKIETNGDETYLYMITQPSNVDNSNCLGITWPIGTKITKMLELFVTVRRRPTQYNSIYLNQFPMSNPWLPLVDSANNLVIQGDKIYFGGTIEKNSTNGDATSGFTRENPRSSIEFLHTDGNKEASFIYRMFSHSDGDPDRIKHIFIVGDGQSQKNIEWTYDFSGDVPTAEVNATFAANFIAESTKGEDAGERYADSALKILNVLYPSVFNRKLDSKQILTITNNTLSDEKKYEAEIINSNDITKFDNRTTQLFGNSYTVDKTNGIVQTAKQLAWVGNDRVSYQSYLGLLARAAGETEERLLKLERLLYGVDYISSIYSIENNYEPSDFKYFIDNEGILRYFDMLSQFGFIGSEDSAINDVFNHDDTTSKGKFNSLLLNFLVDNYGSYGYSDDYVDPKGKEVRRLKDAYTDFMAVDSLPKLIDFIKKHRDDGYTRSKSRIISHLSELWIDYMSREQYRGVSYMTRNARKGDAILPSHEVSNDSLSFTLAKNVTFSKHINGYNTDDEKFHGGSYNHGSPFRWPINIGNPDWENTVGFSLNENFFGNNIIGISDEIKDGYNYNLGSSYACNEYSPMSTEAASGSKAATFAPQSLEGIIYDIIVKLSFIRTKFSYNGRFNSKDTMLSAFQQISFNGSVPTFNDIDTLQFFKDFSEPESTYSAFEFYGDKIVSAYGLNIFKNNPFTEITNYDRFDEENGSLQKMTSRWDKSFTVTINGHSFSEINQFISLYILYRLGELEAEVRTKFQKGITVIEEGKEVKKPFTDDMIRPYVEQINLGLESFLSGYVYLLSEDEVRNYNFTTVPLFSETTSNRSAINKLKLTVDDIKKETYTGNFCYFKEGDGVNDTSGFVSNFKFKKELNLMSFDLEQSWVESLCESFTASNISQDLDTLLCSIETLNLSTEYLKNTFCLWKHYDSVYRKITFVHDRTDIYLNIDHFNMNTFSYEKVVPKMSVYISNKSTALSKYEIFFGLLDGITGENSEFEQNAPWLQKPISENGLTWTDKKGQSHSADFNDYINKVSHPIISYNLFAEDDEIIFTIKDAEETDPQVVKDRGWKYVLYMDSDTHNESEITDSSIDVVPVTLIADHDEYLNNNYGYNMRNSNSENKSLYEEILDKEEETKSSINRESIQIGEILEPKVPGHSLIAFEQSEEYVSKDNGVNGTKYKVRIPPYTEYDGDFEYQDTDKDGNALYYDIETFEVTTAPKNELLGENIIKYAPKKNNKGQILYLTADGKETIYAERAAYFDWSENTVHKYAYDKKPHYKDVYNYKDYTDESQGGFKKGHFIEKEFFSDGINGSYEESIPTDVRHDVLIKDNTKDTTQGGDKSQRVEKNINKDSILMSSRENENILIDTASCEENNRNKPRTFVQDIDAKTELNDNKDDEIKLYSNIENHAVKEYELSFANKDALVDVSLTVDGKLNENFNNITDVSSSTQFVKAGLSLQSQEYVRSDLEILTTEKEGGYIDGFELDAQDAIAADGFEFKPAQKETTSGYLTSIEVDKNDASKVEINEDCQDTVVKSVDVESAIVDVSTIKDAVESITSKTNGVIDDVNTTKGVLKNIIAKVNEIVSKLEGVGKITDSVSENISQINGLSLNDNLDVNVTLNPTQLKISSLLGEGLNINDANITLKSEDDIPSLTHSTTKPSIVNVTRHIPELKFSKHTPVFENYAEGNAEIDVETQKIGLTTKANKFYFDHSFVSSERVLEHKSVISSMSSQLKLTPNDSISSATVAVRYKKIDSGKIIYKTNSNGTIYEETMKNSEFSNAQTTDGWTPVIDRVVSLGTNIKQITFNPLEHKHEITRNNEVVYTQGNFDHAYKEYYVKPLHRNLISLEDSFYRAPVIKTTVEKSIGRYDYHQSKYVFNTRTIRPTITEGNTFIHEFKYKDKSYIHGHMLPMPDIKLKLDSDRVLSLIKLKKCDPQSLENDTDESVNLSVGDISAIYNIYDSSARLMFITKGNSICVIESLTVIAFKTSHTDKNKPIKTPLKYIGSIEKDNGTSKGYIEFIFHENMTNYIIIPKIRDIKGSGFMFIPSAKKRFVVASAKPVFDDSSSSYSFSTGEGGNYLPLDTYNISSLSVNYAEQGKKLPETQQKPIDFDIWKDFITNSLLSKVATSNGVLDIKNGSLTLTSKQSPNVIKSASVNFQEALAENKISIEIRMEREDEKLKTD